MKVLIIILFSVITHSVFGQLKISGIVEQSDGSIVSYANIGIRNKNVGTVSNEKGEFTILIPQNFLNDTLSFSCVGFEELNLKIKNIIQNKLNIFQLTQKNIELKEVIVLSKQLKTVKIGVKSYSPFITSPSINTKNQDIYEFAQFININDKPSLIISTIIMLFTKQADTATFRINFYNIKDGLPFKKIFEKNIIERSPVSKGWITIDLSKYNIKFHNNFFIGFEFLPDDKIHSFNYGARIGGYVIARQNSLGNWIKQKGGSVSCYITAKQ